MSDKSSESSGEWVVLDENEELCLGNEEEQQMNLQLSYNAVCDAVSESIRSSISSEELEWQYEQFQDFIPQYRSSGIEELYYPDFDAEYTEDLDVKHAENNDTSKCVSASDFQDDKSVEISSVSKSHCYKHTRNDHLNFVLNLMLALVFASAVGLGIGHFLGWSHKCHKSTSELDAAYSPNIPDAVVHSSQVLNAVAFMQNVESFLDQEKEVMSPASFSENLSDISCLNPKGSSSSVHKDIFNDIVIDTVVPETSVLSSEGVQELKIGEINPNNFSDVVLSHVSNVVTHIDWNKINHITESFNNLNEPLEKSSIQRESSVDTVKSAPEKIFSFDMNKIPVTGSEKLISEEMSSFSHNNFGSKGTVNTAKIELLKQTYIKDNEAYKESNLTNQLRQDLREVIQSLITIAVARFTYESDSNPLLVENSELIVKYYNDFENLINFRLSEIDNFVMSSEYKQYEKISSKHLQKMVYSLIDSVDYLMKVSIKTLSINNKRLNLHKYLNNIDKVFFTFNKRWEKNSRHWSENVKKVKFQEVKEKTFKKENKYWKRKSQFQREHRNSNYQRYSMKS